jgi:hypothetical protein
MSPSAKGFHYVSVTPVSTYVYLIGPGLVTFLICEYFALGFRRRIAQVLASLLLLPLTGLAFIVGLLFMPVPGC